MPTEFQISSQLPNLLKHKHNHSKANAIYTISNKLFACVRSTALCNSTEVTEILLFITEILSLNYSFSQFPI